MIYFDSHLKSSKSPFQNLDIVSYFLNLQLSISKPKMSDYQLDEIRKIVNSTLRQEGI